MVHFFSTFFPFSHSYSRIPMNLRGCSGTVTKGNLDKANEEEEVKENEEEIEEEGERESWTTGD